jgi:phosphatidylinositol glycan class B
MVRTARLDNSAIVIVAGLIISAFMLRFVIAIFLPNIHHSDEIFQTLEPAHRLATGWGVVPWEWRDGIRSWLFPAFLYSFMQFFRLLDQSAFGALTGIAAAFSGLSLSVVIVGYLLGRRYLDLSGGLLVGGICAVWPDLVYFAPKTLTEVVAGHILVIAAYLAHSADWRRDWASPKYFGSIGLLLGLAFCFRFHLSLALLVVAIWACRSEWRSRWVPLFVGGAIPIILVGSVDLVTWGTPFQSIWKNFWVNVVEGRSHYYGTSPPYWYFGKIISLWGAALVPLAGLFIVGARKVPLFALCALLIWLTHIPLAHKEMRFLYPAVPMIMIVAGVGSAIVIHSLKSAYPKTDDMRIAAAALTCWVMMAALVGVGSSFRKQWFQRREELAAQAAARVQSDLCGLGLVGVDWWHTGGYTHLDRPVPIYLHSASSYGSHPSRDFSETILPSFNYAITTTQNPISNSFEVKGCWGNICLQRRGGVCSGDSTREINRLLKEQGE